MKKIFAIFIILAVVLIVMLSGCLRKIHLPFLPEASQEEPAESEPLPPPEPESPEPESEPEKAETPDGAAEILLENINNLSREQVDELIGQYFGGQALPDEYFALLMPISERLTYEIGEYKIDGDKASVNVSVTAVDAQSAINSVMPRAVAHLAAMQLTGKDISNPEKILAEYAANNIKWDEIPTIEKESTLYLAKGADGEWKVDAANPGNLDFANSISGGAIDVANNLKAFTDRYK